MGAHDALWTTAAILLQGSENVGLLLIAGTVAGVLAFFGGFRAWRRLRLVEDTPTSKVRSMALGRVELHGRAEEKASLRAPFTGAPCVYYRFLLEELVRSGRNRRWRKIAGGDSAAWPFYLEDETDRALVDPRDASVHIKRDFRKTNPRIEGTIGQFLAERGIEPRRWLGRRTLRFSEWRIGAGEPLYVLGVAHERLDLAHERRQRIAEKLAALKSDPEAMAHFDTDGDGQISSEEWEVARQLAIQGVEREGVDDRVVVGKGPDGGAPFLISDRPELGLRKTLRFKALGGVYGGAALTVACLSGLLYRMGLLGGG